MHKYFSFLMWMRLLRGGEPRRVYESQSFVARIGADEFAFSGKLNGLFEKN